MCRSTVFSGWLSAGLFVFAAASALHAQTIPAGWQSALPGSVVSGLTLAYSSPPVVHVPSAPRVSAPRVSTPKVSTPKVSTPKTATPKAATPKAVTPKAATPKTATPKAVTPKTATPAPRASHPPASPKPSTAPPTKTPSQATSKTPSPNGSGGSGKGTPKNPSTAGPTGSGKPAPGGSGATRNTKPETAAGSKPNTGAGSQAKGGRGPATYQTRDKQTVAHIQNGHVTQMQRGNTTIRRPGGGPRTVMARRGDRTVVARGAGHGYVQRSVRVGSRNFVQRTYYVNGVAYVHAYRPFLYHGVMLNVYAPLGYYPVGFYGWAMGPWGVPVNYPWGWGGSPWFSFYGPYFRPWNTYPSPSFWLTDYMLANTLQAAFQDKQETHDADSAIDSNPADADAPQAPQAAQAMPDDVKNMIEAEVRRQLAEAQSEAQSPQQSAQALPQSLAENGAHLFVAADNLEVQNIGTQESCVIGAGDAIQIDGGLPQTGSEVHVLVRASKTSDCPVNSTVSLPLADLVEMHNNMRETIDRGLEALRAGQGSNNLPSLPAEAAGAATPTTFASSILPDPDAANVIAETSSQADQMEKTVIAEYRADPSPSPLPEPPAPEADSRLASIQAGQTERQVVAILGQPLSVSFLGGLRKVHEYPSGKITFTDGEVSEVEVSGAPTEPTVQPAAPARTRAAVTAGMTESQVVAALGQPLQVSFLGGLKKMYVYSDCKVIFTDGDVSEVQ